VSRFQALKQWVRGRSATATPPPFYDQFRDPKRVGPIALSPTVIEEILRQLAAFDFDVRKHSIDVATYHSYLRRAGYADRYPEYYSFNIQEKSLEHFIAATLLDLNPDDTYIDIASEGSPVPEIYERLYGCKTYRQDLAYPAGLSGDTIGGDAAAMPIPADFASKLGLHCSFEHFEGDADMRFAREIQRVLRPGGALCIVPLYLYEVYAIQTDPNVSAPAGVEFEDDSVLFLDPTWQNRHGRFYDAAHLARRVRDLLPGLTMTVHHITNPEEVDPSCYVRFAALIQRPPADRVWLSRQVKQPKSD
jgi:SAM-dependent methyltransferase